MSSYRDIQGQLQKNSSKKIGCGPAIGIGLLVVACVFALMSFTAWIAMMVTGALFPTYGWETPSFWQAFGWTYLIAFTGQLWNGSARGIRIGSKK